MNSLIMLDFAVERDPYSRIGENLKQNILPKEFV